MNARIKLKSAAPRSREEMEQLVGEITDLKNSERTLKAVMDAELKTLKDHYLENLSAISERIAQKMPRALAWAEAHPEDFGKAKSIEMLHGVIGWRTNTPSLKPLSGWTWDHVLEKIKSLPRLAAAYVRKKEEVNKQGLLADREAVGPDGLHEMGLRVMQEDEFFVDPKLTDTETREVAS